MAPPRPPRQGRPLLRQRLLLLLPPLLLAMHLLPLLLGVLPGALAAPARPADRAAADRLGARHRSLQEEPGTPAYAATLTYQPFFYLGAFGYARCQEGDTCTMLRDGYVRFGRQITTGEYFAVYSGFIGFGEKVNCTVEFFGQGNPHPDPKFCDISVATPTPRPTPRPTDQPTERVPTARPSASPSSAPSPSPTPEPTDKPTASPTLKPTPEPTPKPTKEPTTLKPTDKPTEKPTPNPTTTATTASPTPAPTTAKPSPSPSESGPALCADQDTGTACRAMESCRWTGRACEARVETESPSTSPTSGPSASPTIDPFFVCIRQHDPVSCRNIEFCRWTTNGCIQVASATDAPTLSPTSLDGDGAKNDGDEDRANGMDDSEFFGWVSILATNLAILGIVLSLCALLFIHIHRDKPVIQLSQALFLKLICIGALLVNTSIFPNSFVPRSTAICIARKWWFDVTFAFIMSVMLVKVWRVWKIFSVPFGQVMQITNSFLLKIVFAIVAVDILFLLLWTVVDPPYLRFDPGTGSNVCESGPVGTAFMIISYVYLAGLVILTSLFACRVKDLGSVLGESKQIFAVANNIVVFGVFNVIIALVAEQAGDNVHILVFAISIFWCTTVGLIVLLQAKYERFHLTRNEILRAVTDKKNTQGNNSQSTPTENVGQTYATNQTTTGNTNFMGDHEGGPRFSGNAPHAFMRGQSQQHPFSRSMSLRTGQSDQSSLYGVPEGHAFTDDAPRPYFVDDHAVSYRSSARRDYDAFSFRSGPPSSPRKAYSEYAGAGVGAGAGAGGVPYAGSFNQDRVLYTASTSSGRGGPGPAGPPFEYGRMPSSNFPPGRPPLNRQRFRATDNAPPVSPDFAGAAAPGPGGSADGVDTHEGVSSSGAASAFPPSRRRMHRHASAHSSQASVSSFGTARSHGSAATGRRGLERFRSERPAGPQAAGLGMTPGTPRGISRQGRGASESSSTMNTPPVTAESETVESPAAPAAAPQTRPLPVKEELRTLVANGFKIGERGDWEEFVHRETGESFWLHKQTGEVSQSLPNEPVQLT